MVGGGLLATIAFYLTKTRFLLRMQKDKIYCCEYDYVKIGDTASGYSFYLPGYFDFDSNNLTGILLHLH